MITRQEWRQVLLSAGVSPATAVRWAPRFEARVQPELFSVGAAELDDFVGQVLHETAKLESLEENLNYSSKRLCQVWPVRFPDEGVAAPYAFNPERLANKTYGGRMGNTEPGDGWRYRGRGIPMVTGKDNYELLEHLTGMPLVANPDLLKDPDMALQCAVLWWEKKVPDSAIDSIDRVSRAVQGGTTGLSDRQALTLAAGKALQSLGLHLAIAKPFPSVI